MGAGRNYQESSLGRYPPYGGGASRSGGSCSIATSRPEPDSDALEAMGSVQEGPRELSISTEQTQGNGFLVTVRDTGPGIDPENMDRVFEALYNTKSSGVGMGLSICRSIIDAQG